ncbi:DNA gyrase inhibitor YacG [Allofranklinella schreckenbergeri]|uniref:DNA gyrase inhibitor YacG n=1 Tax=Allofranklinella schreckenbergeri TaxID=1076744 RepID=A0A3M6QWK1_9BURK|nr:DNA gyrase inhibitor YacG [Allofranklinella schreckenbergeri]RMW98499.1 DNA gyrase inhibitor YacG [Allofranklinella schreckenbergeri]RMW99283.1 DNA gyrase inhibitor YacG [Allofranklinella schreckenbergeri]RMX07377.1 DNA gyrase inhibitor YacG [Allofranklinella schreckenbergeri]RRD39816.1 DNA gyrase inhibitor YacG [Comamonadaceae bacterium OH3737_COT-264]
MNAPAPTPAPADAAPPAAAAPIAIACPRCRTMTQYAPSNPWRPFCSQRCQKIDMGAWASETFRIEAAPPGPDDAPE